jgi:hypothetical protein
MTGFVPNWAGNVPALNVRDYGAVGNGTGDDGPSIQAAFDAAFGTAGSPHSDANKALNRPVYIPNGVYNVGNPLYLTDVHSGWIFGAGMNNTRLQYTGSNVGNTHAFTAPGKVITPLIMMNGVQYSRIEGLNLFINVANSACIYNYTQAAGSIGGPNTSTLNTFNNLLLEGSTAGVLAGYEQQNGTCSECLYTNVSFANCTSYGLRVIGQNSLNHWVVGGGASSCDVGYSCPSGSIPLIFGAALAGSTTRDVDFGTTVASSIVGCRSESTNFLLTGGYVSLQGIQQEGPSSGIFVDTGTAGSVTVDECRSTVGTFHGSNDGQLWIRGGLYQAGSGLFTSFTGTVAEYLPQGALTFANLPAASAAWKRIVLYITDGSSAWSAANVGVAPTGGGSNVVPVRCPAGTTWVQAG